MLKESGKFVGKITLVHVITYIACGMVAMTLFHYQSSLTSMDRQQKSRLSECSRIAHFTMLRM